MLSLEEARRIALDDQLSAHPNGQTVIIGCGNLLRGDDAIGPIVIRHLWERGVPDHVTIVDGGTGGMDVAFKMRAAREVVIIDAAHTGAEPGTIYRVPGEELATLPPVDGLHTHQFRWDHALAFGRWLLGDQYPSEITVYLIEAEQVVHGAELSEVVEAAIPAVLDQIDRHIERNIESTIDRGVESTIDGPVPGLSVVLTADGHLQIDAAVAAEYFPSDAAVAAASTADLTLTPLHDAKFGGLLLKQRNRSGDRSVLVADALTSVELDPAALAGPLPACWDTASGSLRIGLPTTPHQPTQSGRPSPPDPVHPTQSGEVRSR